MAGFFEYHTSEEYFERCLELFEKPLLTAYGQIFFDKIMNGTKGIRGLNDNSDTVTDCQFVVHEPLQHDTTTRTAHLDNPVEIYAGLFYLKRPDDLSSGGDFEIYSTENDETIVDQALGRQVDPTAISISKTVRYRPNAFCMFLNVKNSIHGVSPRVNAKVRRRSVNIIGELNNGDVMWQAKNKRSISSAAKRLLTRLS